MLYQPPPHVAYSPHISIDGINLNAVEHFTYLGSVISSDATISKDLDDRLSKASSSSASPQRSRYTGPFSFQPSGNVPTLQMYFLALDALGLCSNVSGQQMGILSGSRMQRRLPCWLLQQYRGCVSPGASSLSTLLLGTLPWRPSQRFGCGGCSWCGSCYFCWSQSVGDISLC